MLWKSVKDYFDEHADEAAKRRCKNIPQKRAYLVKELGVTLQFDACQRLSRSLMLLWNRNVPLLLWPMAHGSDDYRLYITTVTLLL